MSRTTGEKARVLAVGAHPDDVEIGCFGTLLRHKHQGDEVTIVVTTRGGYGARNWSTISSEAQKASEQIGSEYIILDNRIGHYEMNWKTVTELDDVIRKRRIDTVYTVWHGDSHQDHWLTFRNVAAACRKKIVRNLFCYELSDYSYRSPHTFEARHYVDITRHMQEKLKAIRCYKSYITQKHLNAVIGLARHRGLACNAKYAESFEPIFSMWK